MSHHESETDDSSNDGSGTDSEEDQKGNDGSSHSESGSDPGSESGGSDTDDTDRRYMVVKNIGDKRAREDEVVKEPASKKLRKPVPGNKEAKSDPHSPPRAIKATPVKTASKKPGEVKKHQKQMEPEKPPKQKESEKELTPKKAPQTWTNEDEQVLTSYILKDMKTGIKPPKRGSRGENYHYWGDLQEACQGKFIADWSKEQLYDKYRRMKSRYDAMAERERLEGATALKFKNPGEEKVFNMWKQIYEMQEQEEPEAQLMPKVENKRPRTPGIQRNKEAKDNNQEGSAEPVSKDAPSTSKKMKQGSRTKSKEEPKENGTVNGQVKENINIAALQDIQNKTNARLEEIQGRVNQIMNDFEVRSQATVDTLKGSGGRPEWLADWLMLSMARTSSPLFSVEMPNLLVGGLGTGVLGWLGGIWDGNSPAAVKFKEHWLEQQAQELRVMEQRLRLLQDLCHHQQDLLKKQANSESG